MNRQVSCALVAAAFCAVLATPAQAVVNVQLNLRYNDPADPTEGGTWQLLGQSTTTGIAGLAIRINGNLGVTGVDTPITAIIPNPVVWNNASEIFRFQLSGGQTEIVAGDNLIPPVTMTIGTGLGTPGNVPKDDLFPNAPNMWDNSALIASGAWTGGRPSFGSVEANVFSGSVVVLGTVGTLAVRGDSLASLGLEPGGAGILPGDANRDGVVTIQDGILIAANWDPTATGKGWDQGDFNDNGSVGPEDLAWFGASYGGSAGANAPAPAPAVVEYRLLIDGNAGSSQQLTVGDHTLEVQAVVTNNPLVGGGDGGLLQAAVTLAETGGALTFDNGGAGNLWQAAANPDFGVSFAGILGSGGDPYDVLAQTGAVNPPSFAAQASAIGVGGFETLFTGSFHYDGTPTVLSAAGAVNEHLVATNDGAGVAGRFPAQVLGASVALSLVPEPTGCAMTALGFLATAICWRRQLRSRN